MKYQIYKNCYQKCVGLHIVRLDGLGKDKLFLLVGIVFCEKIFQHFMFLACKCLTSQSNIH